MRSVSCPAGLGGNRFVESSLNIGSINFPLTEETGRRSLQGPALDFGAIFRLNDQFDMRFRQSYFAKASRHCDFVVEIVDRRHVVNTYHGSTRRAATAGKQLDDS